MFRLSESNRKFVSRLPSARNFAEGNWARGEAVHIIPQSAEVSIGVQYLYELPKHEVGTEGRLLEERL